MSQKATHPGSGRGEKGVTLVELLVVISIVMFLAGAIVVASQQVRAIAQRNATWGLLRQLDTAIARYFDDWRIYPADTYDAIQTPGGSGYRRVGYRMGAPEVEQQGVDNEIPGFPGRGIPTRGIEMLKVALCDDNGYMMIGDSNLAGPARNPQHPSGRSWTDVRCIIVDSWGRPIFYDCHNPEGRPYSGISFVRHNIESFDMFSLGPDGISNPTSNEMDDDADGIIDDGDEYRAIGMAGDDMNNWSGTKR